MAIQIAAVIRRDGGFDKSSAANPGAIDPALDQRLFI
jgi:hypothetical protein